MNETWIALNKKADFYALAEKFHIDPVIARVIRNRDVIGEEAVERYLNSNAKLYDPRRMKDMEQGVAKKNEALQQKVAEL